MFDLIFLFSFHTFSRDHVIFTFLHHIFILIFLVVILIILVHFIILVFIGDLGHIFHPSRSPLNCIAECELQSD